MCPSHLNKLLESYKYETIAIISGIDTSFAWSTVTKKVYDWQNNNTKELIHAELLDNNQIMYVINNTVLLRDCILFFYVLVLGSWHVRIFINWILN